MIRTLIGNVVAPAGQRSWYGEGRSLRKQLERLDSSYAKEFVGACADLMELAEELIAETSEGERYPRFDQAMTADLALSVGGVGPSPQSDARYTIQLWSTLDQLSRIAHDHAWGANSWPLLVNGVWKLNDDPDSINEHKLDVAIGANKAGAKPGSQSVDVFLGAPAKTDAGRFDPIKKGIAQGGGKPLTHHDIDGDSSSIDTWIASVSRAVDDHAIRLAVLYMPVHPARGKVAAEFEWFRDDPRVRLLVITESGAYHEHGSDMTDVYQIKPEMTGDALQGWVRDWVAGVLEVPEPVDVHEGVEALSDEPSTADRLHRTPLAIGLAGQINAHVRRNRREGIEHPLLVHVDGDWGSGKSTLLGLLTEQLDKRRSENTGKTRDGKAEEPLKPWIVVEFDAWQHQHARPHWASLMQAIVDGTIEDLRGRDRWLSWRVRWKDLYFRLRLRHFAHALGLLLVLAVLWFFMRFVLVDASGTGSDLLKVLGSLATVVVTLIGIGKLAPGLIAGLAPQRAGAAEQLRASVGDGTRLFVDHFCSMIKMIDRPVAVYIDNLDRCDAENTVDLMNTVQTQFRDAPVTYVVAADHRWLCASYGKVYADFDVIGAPGRPTEHLFLEKIFQLTVRVPPIDPAMRPVFLAHLLGVEGDGSVSNPGREQEIRKQAEADIANTTGESGILDAIDRIAETQPSAVPVYREVAAREMTSERALRRLRHALLRYEVFLEPNPRSMIRLVNAYSMQRIISMTMGRSADDIEERVLWTIVRMRWPKLGESLARNPGHIRHLRKTPRELEGEDHTDADRIPTVVKRLCGDPALCEVLDGARSIPDEVGETRTVRVNAKLDEHSLHRVLHGRPASIDAEDA